VNISNYLIELIVVENKVQSQEIEFVEYLVPLLISLALFDIRSEPLAL
jgi:hypothetical protein